jgi:hypothetical protein
VAEQELDLLDISAVLSAEFGAGAAQVVRPEALDPDLFGRLLDHRPDCPAAHALLNLAAFGHGAKQPAIFHACGGHPGVDSLLDPHRDRHRANASSLPFEICQHPAALPQLDRIDIEQGELLPAQDAADQHAQQDVIPLALERRAVWNGEQCFRLFARQPVAEASSLLRYIGVSLEFGHLSTLGLGRC